MIVLKPAILYYNGSCEIQSHSYLQLTYQNPPGKFGANHLIVFLLGSTKILKVSRYNKPKINIFKDPEFISF